MQQQSLDKKQTQDPVAEVLSLFKNQQSMQDRIKTEQKKIMKEEAKQWLLKGCYRVASNKYLQIINMGLDDLPPRQQAIIYLNCGICYQFMSEDNEQNYLKALELMKNSVLADCTYEKTYYRLVQLLRDHGNYESALSIVPVAVRNKEIEELLKEVRQEYVKQFDFSRMLQKFTKLQLTPQNGKMLCLKLAQTVDRLLQSNMFSKQPLHELRKTQIRKISQDICLLYQTISEGKVNSHQHEESQSRKIIMQQFVSFLSRIFLMRLQDKSKVIVIDELMENVMKQYRGNLYKFLEYKVWFKLKDIQLPVESMFTVPNQFVVVTKRKTFYDSELQLIKLTRLVDINLELFGKAYCYLSNKAYENVHRVVLKKPPCQPDNNNFDFRLIHKFLFTNKLQAQQVISTAMSKNDQKIKYTVSDGGHPLYFYEHVKFEDLNFIKAVLVQECHKISQVYESIKIHPVWLQRLNEVLYSVECLLGIVLNMLHVYSSRESNNMNTLVNRLSEVCQLSHLIYIYHWELYSHREKMRAQQSDIVKEKNHKHDDKDKEVNSSNKSQPMINSLSYSFLYNYEQLLDYFQKENDNFIALYLMQKILQFAIKENKVVKKQKDNLNQASQKNQKNQNNNFADSKQRAISICTKKASLLRQRIKQQKQSTQDQNLVSNQMYLLVTCMLLKLDIKRKTQIDKEIIFNSVFNDVTSDVALQVFLLILINDPGSMVYYLENYKNITNIVNNFLSKPLIEQLEPFGTLLNVIYMLVCDFEFDQEVYFAKKLGVSQKQVHQVRILQKQAMENKEKQSINKLKKAFKHQLGSQWHQILSKLCKLLRITFQMQPYCSTKLCKIISSVAEVNYSKLYSSQIIQFMLEARNIKQQPGSMQQNTKETACKFFQMICKKCNAQIFEYKHLQAIVDSLLWLISNCEHQLVHFESLLGLVNLSTMSVRIPIEEIEKCLYEENSYIMHAGVCVMNNILAYNEQLEEDEKNQKIRTRISDVVYKYIEFYRDQILTVQSHLPETDYSHPKKIYNSLISLATVLGLDKLEELESWQNAIKYIKILSKNDASDLLFKLAIYHSILNKLPRNWHHQFQTEINTLQKNEPQKYLKITQLM